MGAWNSVKLVVGGSITGSNKSTGATLPGSDTYVSFGGSTDKWGLTPTASQINASNFGVVVGITVGGDTSYYIKATNFGFTVSDTIDGILVEVECKSSLVGEAYQSDVDHIRITVYYTVAASGQPTIRRFSHCRGFRPVGIGSEGVTIG